MPKRRVDYRLGESSQVLGADERFDVVLALEVVEHASDVPAVVDTVARSVQPGGLLFASTIDRTWKSYLFAIVGAGCVLRVLPLSTHQWRQFVRPTELTAAVSRSVLQPIYLRGMHYNPFQHTGAWCADTRVNYMGVFKSVKGG